MSRLLCVEGFHPSQIVYTENDALLHVWAYIIARRHSYDHVRMTRAPAAVRFQARRSNELWQFDLSPSDLKHVTTPLWIEPGRGAPTLMIYSLVDDRSGVAYQEYRCVYGEDVEAALRFLFNAMARKADPTVGLREHIEGHCQLNLSAHASAQFSYGLLV